MIMKTIKLLVAALFLVTAVNMQAQTAEEIVANYLENTGGEDAWRAIKSIKMKGKAAFGPQEFPFTQMALADGRMAVEIELQGQKFIPQAFDGENVWGTNFQSQKAETQDSESSTNFKNNEAKNIIDTFLDYKEKGFKVDKLDDKTIEGVDCFAVKLTLNPVLVEGKEEESFSTYYFDKENFVPILSESIISSGPQKGATTQTLYSDYQEAGSVYYAYNIVQKFNGQVGQSISIESIEINPDIDESVFEMPKN